MSTRMGLADFQRNNLWATFAVAGALLAFLFLPDMLGFEGGFHFDEAKDNFSFHIPKPGSGKQSDRKEPVKFDRDISQEKEKTVSVKESISFSESVEGAREMTL